MQKRGCYGREENDLLSEMWKKNRHLGWAVNYGPLFSMQEMQETSRISCLQRSFRNEEIATEKYIKWNEFLLGGALWRLNISGRI